MRYFCEGVLLQQKNAALYYKKCVFFNNKKMFKLIQKMRAYLQKQNVCTTTKKCVFLMHKMCILFFNYTYNVLLIFRPSNIKMVCTRLIEESCGICEMCMCLARGGVGRDGGEWIIELGLGFTNPVGAG